MTENNKKIVVLTIIGLIILLLYLFQENKENSLIENQQMTIGKIIDVTMCGRKPSSRCITYKYLIHGKWIDGTDPERAAYPEFVREGKPEIGKYYLVIYDKTDINNAKILITKEPLTQKQTEKYLN